MALRSIKLSSNRQVEELNAHSILSINLREESFENA